jgi:hypothetical protein
MHPRRKKPDPRNGNHHKASFFPSVFQGVSAVRPFSAARRPVNDRAANFPLPRRAVFLRYNQFITAKRRNQSNRASVKKRPPYYFTLRVQKNDGRASFSFRPLRGSGMIFLFEND